MSQNKQEQEEAKSMKQRLIDRSIQYRKKKNQYDTTIKCTLHSINKYKKLIMEPLDSDSYAYLNELQNKLDGHFDEPVKPLSFFDNKKQSIIISVVLPPWNKIDMSPYDKLIGSDIELSVVLKTYNSENYGKGGYLQLVHIK